MIRTRWSAVGMLWAVVAAFSLPAFGATISWKNSRTGAVEAARNSARLILLLAGRDTCGNCQYMKETVCESAGVRPVLQANYVCWYCPVDYSTEWYAYASGLGSFTLPLICVVDPGDATAYLDRTTATQTVSAFSGRLGSHLPTQPIALVLVRDTVSHLAWETESPIRYRVLRSQNLKAWSFVGGIVPGTGSTVSIDDTYTAPGCFYKVLGFR
ncbi:MAG TPA: thioredoxin family protein [Verrucomicrobiota bacterium]|nr:thioredoxin family protein [Verrucomicrobiota bacterium]HNU51060.1 thioredoxin family protein [Verrucomicrobiota bacterium]